MQTVFKNSEVNCYMQTSLDGKHLRGKNPSKKMMKRLKSELRCFLVKIGQIQKEPATVEGKDNFSRGKMLKLLCLSLANSGNTKLPGRFHWPHCGLYPTLMEKR